MRRTVAAASVLIACLGTACGTDAAPLPPAEASELVALYEDELARLGMRLTDRGGLTELGSSGGDYRETPPDAAHLALYVEPVEQVDADAYVRGLVEVTRIFATDIFERWPDLESFDVCQEVFSSGDTDLQQPLTVVQMTREVAGSIDWETAELVDLLTAVRGDPDSHVITVGPVERHPEVEAARAAAAP